MAKINEVPPGGRTTRRDGRFVTQLVRGGALVVRSWPKKRGPQKDPAQIVRVTDYGLAQRHSTRPHPWDHEAAISQSIGTMWNWRELIVKGLYGVLTEVYLPGGVRLSDFTTMKNELQAWLETLGGTAGQVIARDVDEWVAVDPAPAGYVLTSNGPGFLPSWQPGGGGGGGGAWIWGPFNDAVGGASNVLGTMMQVCLDFNFEHYAVSGNWNGADDLVLGVYELDSSSNVAAIIVEMPLNPPSQGQPYTFIGAFDKQYTLTAGVQYAICCTRIGSGAYSQPPVYEQTVPYYGWPMNSVPIFIIASADPVQVGDNLRQAASGRCAAISLGP